MYKVSVNNNLITFSDNPSHIREGEMLYISHLPEGEASEEFSFTKLLQKLLFTKQLHIISPAYNEIFEFFRSTATVIRAGGGLTFNNAGNVLMIYRMDKWDLPKGKCEKDEAIENCALREVEEECSLHGLILDEFITDTYHVYKINNKAVLKQTSWYKMRYTGDESPKPQTEEDINFAGWIEVQNIPEKLQNSYNSIIDVCRSAGLI